MINAQEWLDQKYPKEGKNRIFGLNSQKRNEIKKLKKLKIPLLEVLTGTLNLSDFTNLEELRCSDNQLTEIILPINNQLKIIDIRDNLLNKFDYESPNAVTLTHLMISNNNLPKTDIVVFSKLINLVELNIGNYNKERIDSGIYNRFYGSLESLKDLIELEILNISNSDISAGVEFLSSSLKEISYSTLKIPNCKLTRIKADFDFFKLNRKDFRKKKMQEKLDEQSLELENASLKKQIAVLEEKIRINESDKSECSEYPEQSPNCQEIRRYSSPQGRGEH